MTKTPKKILLTIWAVIALIVVLTWLTHLEFTSDLTNSILTAVSVVGFPLIFWFTTADKEKKIKWWTWTVFLLTLTLLTIMTVDFFSWGGGFKTQDIIYRQKGNPDNRIELQMKDIGAFGYNRRTVKIIQLTPLFQWTTTMDTDNIDTILWTNVDEYVNELRLKGG